MGLDIYLYKDKAATESEELPDDVASDKYPDHLCKKTYLRSSYNSGGYNRVVGDLINEDFYSIFGVDGKEYEFSLSKDELKKALSRAKTVLTKLQKVRPLRVATVSHNIFTGISNTSPEEAIAITNKKLDKNKDHECGKWYGCREGDFFLDGFKFIAAIPGIDALKSPGVHLVYEADLTWYIQATEIAIEFIEYALSLETPIIHWSG